MHQLILVHSHLLDQSDREGVRLPLLHEPQLAPLVSQNTPLHLAVIGNKEGATSLLLSLNCKSKILPHYHGKDANSRSN